MTLKPRTPFIASLTLVVLFAALAGCSPAQQAATNTSVPPAVSASATPPATSPSATPQEVGATAETTVAAESTAAVSSVSAVDCTRLNLNEETEDQLMSNIPNFSSRMVREFMEYRPYVSILQFRREIGKYVDAAQVAEWEQYVYVPVDPNNADADTLKQIPGVDDAAAANLIAGRPYASTQAFLDALGKSLTAEQLAGAACYLAASA